MKSVHPKSSKEWREWLRKNPKETKVCLIVWKRHTGKPVIDHGLSKNPETPEDLKKALKGKAKEFFESLAPSYRRTHIYMVISAKRKETREKRIKEIVEKCMDGKKF